ncbi:MAG: ATP-binding protein [Verrucomicrobiota bacterium]|jgi:signal transduction histidine kinase
MSAELLFKPRARLILQLGDQLIKNESIALLELVKNSYDAGATAVNIDMRNLSHLDKGEITVRDNGCGMDAHMIKNVWLEPGSDYKSHLLKALLAKKQRPGRLPLGEKGIGRFSAHKLGETVEIISRMQGRKEVRLHINWTDFERARYIQNVVVHLTEREPTTFTGSATGTLINITGLRKGQWPAETLREVFRSVNSMCSPFETPDAFRVSLRTDDPKDFEGIPTLEKIKEAALYSFRCKLEGDKVTQFSYIFHPLPSMTKLSERSVSDKSPGFEKIQRMVEQEIKSPDRDHKEPPSIDLSAKKMKIGPVLFEGLIFDRETKVLKLGRIDGKSVKEYLDKNGGIRIYRDGIRVYDYGEPENDWLDLEQRRLYRPGVKISSKLILAAVHLKRDTSRDLVEKTNREGFVDNEAYRTLVAAVKFALGLIETCRQEDKDKIRLYYGPSPKSEPILASVAELREVVESKIENKEVKKECLKYLDRIERDYQEINEILLTSAEAGLNLGVAIHEIEKIISELKRVVSEERSSGRLIKLIQHLSELIEMYGAVLRRSRQKEEELKGLIDDALFHVHYRLKAHNIETIKSYLAFHGRSHITCSARLVIGSIVNIIDNSIYWLERARVPHKKIIISLERQPQNHLKVVIADNGLGFSLSPEQMVKPFVSMKPGGMGLGLHIVSEVMSAQGGVLGFPRYQETDLPKEFTHGALVALSFKGGNV